MRDKLVTMLWGAALAFMVSFSAVACVVTGFAMSVELGTVALWCGIAAVLGAVCHVLPLHPVPIAAWSVTAAILWITGDLEKSVRALLYWVSRQYDRAYGWGIIRMEHYTAGDLEPMLGMSLCFIGVLIAIGLTWAVCRRKTAIPGVLGALVCFGSCLVVTDTVPNKLCLYFLLLGLALILLTHTVRRGDATRGNRLCAIAALPVALFLLLLFGFVPESSYTGYRTAQTVVNAVLENELVQAVFGDLTEQGNSGSDVSGGVVRLDSVGIRLDSRAEIMQVHTDFAGTLYLRGRALDAYDGQTWTDSQVYPRELNWAPRSMLRHQGEVTIQTRYAHRMLYLPYYVESIDLSDVSRGLVNNKKLTNYSFTVGTLSEETLSSPAGNVINEDVSQYLHLDEQVKKWAQPLARKIIGEKTALSDQVRAIGNYVRSSARYSLKTEAMPARKNDFVKWFLEESDTGYCVHFASSAVVLLQAAGIPARYVTGYMTQVGKDCYTMIREQDAHAWAEYWRPGVGWVVLEATPAAQETPEETLPVTEPEAPEEINWQLVKQISVGVLVALIIGVFIQRPIRLHMRRRRLYMGTLKEQILAHWQEAVLFARCLGGQPEGKLFTIAERVKFSNHQPEAQDLEPFAQYLTEARKQLKRHSLFRKLYYRFVLALY